jgi:hypothetical protein
MITREANQEIGGMRIKAPMSTMPLLSLKYASRSVTAIRAAVLGERRRRCMTGCSLRLQDRRPRSERRTRRNDAPSGRRSVAWKQGRAEPKASVQHHRSGESSRSSRSPKMANVDGDGQSPNDFREDGERYPWSRSGFSQGLCEGPMLYIV